jgi:hypothetical protein
MNSEQRDSSLFLFTDSVLILTLMTNDLSNDME